MSAKGFYGAISSNLSFNRVTIGGDNINPSELEAAPTSYKDRTRRVLASLDIPFKERDEKTLVIALGASSERKDEALKVVQNILEDCFKLLEEKKVHYERFLVDSTVTIETPDRMFDLAFKSAMILTILLSLVLILTSYLLSSFSSSIVIGVSCMCFPSSASLILLYYWFTHFFSMVKPTFSTFSPRFF